MRYFAAVSGPRTFSVHNALERPWLPPFKDWLLAVPGNRSKSFTHVSRPIQSHSVSPRPPCCARPWHGSCYCYLMGRSSRCTLVCKPEG